MKILIIHDQGVFGGGAETYIVDIKKELEKNGHEIKILTGSSYNSRGKFSDEEFFCPDKTQFGKLIFYLFNIFAFIKIRQVIRNYKPDIVHLHTLTRVSPLGLLALRNITKVITVHDYSLIYSRLKENFPDLDVCKYSNGACCFKHTGFRYYFEKFRTNILIEQIKDVDMLFTNSSFMAKTLRKCGVTPTSSLDELGIKLFKHKKQFINNNLLYVGRIEVEKGLKYLLLALSNIKEYIPTIHLSIIGSGSQYVEISNFIGKLGLTNNVKQVPFISRERLQNYYQNSSLVIMPSLWPEPFGLVGIEAFSVGRPVIAADVGGVSDWLEDKKTGFLVKPKDISGISEAVRTYLLNIKRYKYFEKNTIEQSRNYDIKMHVKKLINKYEEILHV